MEDISKREGSLNNKHPRQNTNVISKLFFCWLLPLLYTGWRRDLDEKDLRGVLKQHESGILGDKLQKAWEEELLKKNPSLWRAFAKVFWFRIIFSGVIYLIIEFGIKLAQPLLLDKVMDYYVPNQTTVTKQDVVIHAGLIVFAALLRVLVQHSNVFSIEHLGMRMRVACCSLIYRKALKLNKSALADNTIGQMVNLLANDVARFEMIIHFHNLWGAPILIGVIMYLQYVKLGVTALTGVIVFLIFILAQSWMGKKTSYFRLKTALRADERVRLMNEIICGIEVIKMYTWEKPFTKLLELARLTEMKQIRYTSILRAFNDSFGLFINRFAIYLCILAYVLNGNILDHKYVFVCISFYGMLQTAITSYLPRAILQRAECSVSVKRIERFLLLDEIQYTKEDSSRSRDPTNNSGLVIENASAKWNSSSEENHLDSINLEVKYKEVAAVVGLVGSGKTTLFHMILKELPLLKGSLKVNGKVSYASQEPWLFTGSIKQNILFGEKYDEKKYLEVVRVCALERDFDLFQFGDRTVVGERGAMLSGGQRARINLARAIYKDADIYLLDDPLSAVDATVGKQLFENCICGYLKEKCVVLVTHQLQFLNKVDKIFLLESGKIIESGTFDELRNSDKEFAKLFKGLKESKEEENDNNNPTHTKTKIKIKTEKPLEIKEHLGSGSISNKVHSTYIRAGGGVLKIIAILGLFVLAQVLATGYDYFLTFWVNQEQNVYTEQNDNNNNETVIKKNIVTNEDAIIPEDICLSIFSALIISVITITLLRSVSFYKFCNCASTTLHNIMFDNIVHAPMKFFNDNASGRILNRFSKDLGGVDEILPYNMIDTIQICMEAISVCTIIGIVNPLILAPTFVIFGLFYFFRKAYVASGRNLKRMEGLTRSPVYSHLTASLQGLTTIRAFGAQSVLQREFDNHQNLHSSAFYLFFAANRTFGFWMDFHAVFYIALVTLSFLFIQDESYGGNVGLAITQSLSLCGKFQFGMRQWSEWENQMTSVERIVEYTDVKTETNDTEEVKKPPVDWPKEGNIKFESVSMRYSEDLPFVLKNLNFEIRSKEKIGVVGRTGAGKSSLITALFRLAKIEGNILIDNINTKEISLHDLRSKLSIIPQEPVLFSGSLRKNLDPFDEFNDDLLWNALEEVELKNVINDLPAGLQTKMAEGGSNFSVGQRQLVCLARALLRKNKILILDEATANVDPHTDSLIQSTIRDKFKDCTVLTIAHRLNTIMDSDKVLVMNAGSVAEFDHPHNLCQNKDGVLYGLIEQTGSTMAENLKEIAKRCYNEKAKY